MAEPTAKRPRHVYDDAQLQDQLTADLLSGIDLRLLTDDVGTERSEPPDKADFDDNDNDDEHEDSGVHQAHDVVARRQTDALRQEEQHHEEQSAAIAAGTRQGFGTMLASTQALATPTPGTASVSPAPRHRTSMLAVATAASARLKSVSAGARKRAVDGEGKTTHGDRSTNSTSLSVVAERAATQADEVAGLLEQLKQMQREAASRAKKFAEMEAMYLAKYGEAHNLRDNLIKKTAEMDSLLTERQLLKKQCEMAREDLKKKEKQHREQESTKQLFKQHNDQQSQQRYQQQQQQRQSPSPHTTPTHAGAPVPPTTTSTTTPPIGTAAPLSSTSSSSCGLSVVRGRKSTPPSRTNARGSSASRPRTLPPPPSPLQPHHQHQHDQQPHQLQQQDQSAVAPPLPRTVERATSTSALSGTSHTADTPIASVSAPTAIDPSANRLRPFPSALGSLHILGELQLTSQEQVHLNGNRWSTREIACASTLRAQVCSLVSSTLAEPTIDAGAVVYLAQCISHAVHDAASSDLLLCHAVAILTAATSLSSAVANTLLTTTTPEPSTAPLAPPIRLFTSRSQRPERASLVSAHSTAGASSSLASSSLGAGHSGAPPSPSLHADEEESVVAGRGGELLVLLISKACAQCLSCDAADALPPLCTLVLRLVRSVAQMASEPLPATLVQSLVADNARLLVRALRSPSDQNGAQTVSDALRIVYCFAYSASPEALAVLCKGAPPQAASLVGLFSRAHSRAMGREVSRAGSTTVMAGGVPGEHSAAPVPCLFDAITECLQRHVGSVRVLRAALDLLTVVHERTHSQAVLLRRRRWTCGCVARASERVLTLVDALLPRSGVDVLVGDRLLLCHSALYWLQLELDPSLTRLLATSHRSALVYMTSLFYRARHWIKDPGLTELLERVVPTDEEVCSDDEGDE